MKFRSQEKWLKFPLISEWLSCISFKKLTNQTFLLSLFYWNKHQLHTQVLQDGAEPVERAAGEAGGDAEGAGVEHHGRKVPAGRQGEGGGDHVPAGSGAARQEAVVVPDMRGPGVRQEARPGHPHQGHARPAEEVPVRVLRQDLPRWLFVDFNKKFKRNSVQIIYKLISTFIYCN